MEIVLQPFGHRTIFLYTFVLGHIPFRRVLLDIFAGFLIGSFHSEHLFVVFDLYAHMTSIRVGREQAPALL